MNYSLLLMKCRLTGISITSKSLACLLSRSERTQSRRLNYAYSYFIQWVWRMFPRQDINIVHRVSARKASSRPNPIICKFDRRQVKETSLIDKNLSWKIHIDNVATKLSKTVGLIAKLRHFGPQHTLLNIYRTLISPYLSYGLIVWEQASKTHLTKILLLQKKVIRFIFFCQKESSCHSSFYWCKYPANYFSLF